MVIVHVFDPTYWGVWFAGTYVNDKPIKTAKVKEWCEIQNAELCYNLAFFNLTDKETITYVKGNWKDFGYGGTSTRITVSSGNVCAGHALGIKENEVVIGAGDRGCRSRNGIGLTPEKRVIIAQSTTMMREKEFCEEVKRQLALYFKTQAETFLIQDGGSSTSMYSNFSKLTVAPEVGRAIPTVTCLHRKVPLKINRVLKYGCGGEDVRYLQMVLGGLECDGSFGNATRARVKAAQKALKLTQDGSVGPITLKALGLY